jgi:hypothetical protein
MIRRPGKKGSPGGSLDRQYGTLRYGWAVVPSVAVVGDGGFAMLMAELTTAVANKLPVKIIILKNNSLAEVKFEQIEIGNPEYGCTLAPIDFVAFAKACGADGFRCERPEEVRSAIQAALNSPGVAIVEALVDAEESRRSPENSRHKGTTDIRSRDIYERGKRWNSKPCTSETLASAFCPSGGLCDGAKRANGSPTTRSSVGSVTTLSRSACCRELPYPSPSDGRSGKRRLGFDQSLLFKLRPEFGGDFALQRIVVLGDLLMASRPDDKSDRDIRRCRELKRGGA